NRHLRLMRAGSAVLFNSDTIKPGVVPNGVQLCPFSVKALAPTVRGDLVQNTIALAAILKLVGVEFKILEEILAIQFRRRGAAAVAENTGVARAGYDCAATHFTEFSFSLPDMGKRLAFFEGNQALAMGGAAAGVRFYCAYPMSPASGVLHWMSRHARQLGIMVRQVEDEIGVINMAIGAAHTGCRAMCATSGGGFALMTEALGAAAMMEIPVVCINVQRAGPATGVPTKTEQGDLWQVLGAGQGDYPRIIAAPTSIRDCFHLIPQIFNLADKFQCPAIVLADLLESEGFSTFEPAELDFNPPRDRGEVIGLAGEEPEVDGALSGARNLIIVENNYSGQFARYLRSETGIAADAHIRKYDGEPFLPHHVADGVKKILAGKTDKYVPVHEIRV